MRKHANYMEHVSMRRAMGEDTTSDEFEEWSEAFLEEGFDLLTTANADYFSGALVLGACPVPPSVPPDLRVCILCRVCAPHSKRGRGARSRSLGCVPCSLQSTLHQTLA